MLLSVRRRVGRSHRQPSQRLETVVADIQYSGSVVSVVFMVCLIVTVTFIRVKMLLFLYFTFRITDESMRWLQMQGKHDRVVGVLKRIAGMNKKSLPIMNVDVQIQVIFYFE